MTFRDLVLVTLAFTATCAALPKSVRAQVAGGLPPIESYSGFLPHNDALLRFQFTGGEGVGFDDSYVTFGGFQPIWVSDSALWFFDAQALVYASDGDAGANIGFGRRGRSPFRDAILGASLWYDVNSSYRETYHQISFGLESLGARWDWRSNFYFPVSQTENVVAGSEFSSLFFERNAIIFERSELVETAFTGADFEFGGRLAGAPVGPNLQGFLGGYAYDEFTGISARLMAEVSQDLKLQVGATSDDQFNTNVIFGLTWIFPLGEKCRGRDCVDCMSCQQMTADMGQVPMFRYLQPIQRNPNIVVADVLNHQRIMLTDTETMEPFDVIHVSSYAAPGGDGTFERPFQFLAEAEAGSSPGNIVFAHADSVFDQELFTLQQGQRFLGEGIEHLIDSKELGLVALPRATTGTSIPIIQNSPGSAISVATNSEVSGFNVIDPVLFGIVADNVSEGPVSINRNQVTGGENGIRVRDSAGDFTIVQNTIDSDGRGIFITANASEPLVANIEDNEVTANLAALYTEDRGQPGSLVLSVNNNQFQQLPQALPASDDYAVQVMATGFNSTIVSSFSDNTILGNGSGGGALFEQAAFDADGNTSNGLQTSSGGSLSIGQGTATGQRVLGDGLVFLDTTGGIEFDSLNVFNLGGTSLRAEVEPGTFFLGTAAGTLDAQEGPAMLLRGVTTDITLASVVSTDSGIPTVDSAGTAGVAVWLDGLQSGSQIQLGSLNITDAEGAAVVIESSSGTVDVALGAVEISDTTVGGATGDGIVIRNNSDATTVTLSTLDLTTDGGAGLVAENGGTVNFLATPIDITANGGPAVQIDDVNGQTAGVSGWTFRNLESNDSPTTGLSVNELADDFTVTGTTIVTGSADQGVLVSNTQTGRVVDFQGNTSVTNASGTSVEVNGGDGTVQFGSVAVRERGSTGVLVTGTSGDVTFGDTSVTNENSVSSEAVLIENTTDGSVSFANLAIDNNDASADGLVLSNNSADVDVAGGMIEGAGGDSVAIVGGDGDVSIAASIQNREGYAVNINGRDGGTVTFSGAIRDEGAGQGISITGATGANDVLFDGPVQLGTLANPLTGGDAVAINNAGLDADDTLVRFSQLDIATEDQLALIAANGGTLEIQSGSIDSIGETRSVSLVDIDVDVTLTSLNAENSSDLTTVAFNDVRGSFQVGQTSINGGRIGIMVVNSDELDTNFGTTTIEDTAFDGYGVFFDNNGPDATLTFNSLDITTISGDGLFAVGEGTINLTGAPATIDATGGAAVYLAGVSGQTNGASGWTFGSLKSTDSNSYGVLLTDLPDTVTVTGSTEVTNAAIDGVHIDNIAGASFGAITVEDSGSSTLDAGLEIVNMNDASVSVSGPLTVRNGAGTGLAVATIDNSTLAFSGISIEDAGFDAISIFNVNDSNVTVSAVSVRNANGFGLTIEGATSSNVSVALFEADEIAQTGLYIDDFDGDASFSNVQITNATYGIRVKNSFLDSSQLFYVGSGVVASRVDGVSIVDANQNVTLQSISSSGGIYGIELRNTTGSFRVQGNGLNVSSGGILTGHNFNAVYMQNARNVSLNYLDIRDTSQIGIQIRDGSSQIELNRLSLTDTGEGAVFVRESRDVSFTNSVVDGWGTSAFVASGIYFERSIDGTNVITNNRFANTQSSAFGIAVTDTTVSADFNIAGNRIDLGGGSNIGIFVSNNPATVRLIGGDNNLVFVPGGNVAIFQSSPIVGQILINGVPRP